MNEKPDTRPEAVERLRTFTAASRQAVIRGKNLDALDAEWRRIGWNAYPPREVQEGVFERVLSPNIGDRGQPFPEGPATPGVSTRYTFRVPNENRGRAQEEANRIGWRITCAYPEPGWRLYRLEPPSNARQKEPRP